MFPYVKSRVSVNTFPVKTRVQTRVVIDSEHVKSYVSTGSIHVFPNVNSRDSVDTFSRENTCPETCVNRFRTHENKCP